MPIHDLPPIQAPHCAVAELQQGSVNEGTRQPWYMGLPRNNAGVKLRPVPAPTARACGGTVDLFHAFLATRFPEFCAGPSDAARIASAERAELLAFASREHVEAGPDDSLAPRPLAVAVLFHGACATTSVAHHVLDAVAHLAGSPHAPDPSRPAPPVLASQIRFAVFAGVDAAWYRKSQCGDARPCTDARVDLVLRWADEGDGWEPVVRTELLPYDWSGADGSALEALQTALLRGVARFDLPFLPDSVSADLGVVQMYCWHALQQRASEDFFARMRGVPSVTTHPPHAIVTPTHVHVRIWPRALGTEGVTSPSAFHAVLLCDGEHAAELAARCAQDFATGLPADPAHPDLVRYQLHTCGIQVQGYPLRHEVTLYAASETPGRTLAEPGSWIWRFEPAIVPHAHIAPNFHVVPCTQRSMLPGDKRLVPAFSTYYERAMELGMASHAHQRGDAVEALPVVLEVQRTRPGYSNSRSAAAIAAAPRELDPEEQARRDWAVAALGVRNATPRAAIGDVYMWLRREHAPAELVQFARQAALRFGVNVPLLAVYERCAALLSGQADAATAAAAASHARQLRVAKRVAEGALGVAAAAQDKRLRATNEAAQPGFPPQRVAALIEASGRRIATGAAAEAPQAVPTKAASHSSFVALGHFLAAAVGLGGIDAEAHEEAAAAAAAATAAGAGDLPVVCSSLAVLRAHDIFADAEAPVFLIAGAGPRAVAVEVVDATGARAAATPGALLDAGPAAVVLVLRRTGNGCTTVAVARARAPVKPPTQIS